MSLILKIGAVVSEQLFGQSEWREDVCDQDVHDRLRLCVFHRVKGRARTWRTSQ